MQKHLDELDQQGYTVIPGFMERDPIVGLRAHMDAHMPPVVPADQPADQRMHTLRHPIPGAIMAEVLANPKLLSVAQAILRANELRLLEQVLIRTDPRPGPYGAGGWHADFAFFPSHYSATPRQTYFHMVHCLNTVQPGGGAFMIVPGSHLQNYAVTAKLQTPEQLKEFHKAPITNAGLDVTKGIEVLGREGDLLIFNPMALHSGSHNATNQSRYVYFASFFDVSAKYLWDNMRETKYRDNFPDSLRDNLPAHLRNLLEH